MLPSLVALSIPSPSQGVWELGPFPLRGYALCIILGVVLAVWMGERRWVARGGKAGDVQDLAIWAVPFGLVGGRLYHVLTDWQLYFGEGGNPIEALYVWRGGLGIWGAIALGAVGVMIGAKLRGIKVLPLLDALAPGVLLAQAVGRWGNWFNQELYGRETTVPWGLEIYERVGPDGGAGYPGMIDGVSNGTVAFVVHPTFLYEMLWSLLAVLVLIIVDRYARIGHGRIFALYVALYCFGRFGVELMRDDAATLIAGIRINVFTSVIVFACAVAYFLLASKGREQGLTMYHPWRAEQLAEAGAVGYVDPFAAEEDEWNSDDLVVDEVDAEPEPGPEPEPEVEAEPEADAEPEPEAEPEDEPDKS